MSLELAADKTKDKEGEFAKAGHDERRKEPVAAGPLYKEDGLKQ